MVTGTTRSVGSVQRRVRRVAIGGVLASLVAVQAGCLVTSRSKVEEDGVRVSSATLRMVEPGATTEGWVLAALGEPTARVPVEDQANVEILRYDYRIAKASGGTVFLLFAGGSKTRFSSRTYFEVTDGIVTRYWTEGSETTE